ncbi:hypothetical protein F511_09478 [Dorcoceras hygrometricum]|uniref:Uncharacterized protein n=1 Tax=Dorcoceras hygrometricum TaxID=472368 RepID=A0A2Z7AA85_9LAMI|nr:hypothetical protein F511_09478 [Dorcoceras hygrometricum]
MQIDSDLVIYRTTLVGIFQVVTICRVEKFEALSVIPRGSWGDVASRFTKSTRVKLRFPAVEGQNCHYGLDSIGYPRTEESGESSTTKHRLLHASGPHPTPPPDDPN